MHHGGHGGGGIEGLTPPTGPMTSLVSIGAFLAFVWLIVKHPRVALTCALAGVALALAGLGDGSGVQDSVPLFLLVLVLGCFLADGKSNWRKPERVQAPTPVRPLAKPGELTHQRLAAYVTAQANTHERKAR